MRRLVLVLTLASLVGTGPARGQEWHRVRESPELSFPRDHGSHPSFRTEWWYVTGLLEDPDGRRYGYQLTFFRAGLRPGLPPADASQLRAHQILAAHVAIAETDSGHFVTHQRLRRQGAGLAGASEDRLRVWLENWELVQEADGTILASAASVRGQDALELRLTPAKPVILHGKRGYSQKGADPGNASVYLSWTRLATRGQLTLGSRQVQVTGESWFDHEWGTSQLGEGVVGWDWFGLRLADGRDLMIYRLRQEDGTPSPWSAGTLVDSDGSSMTLVAEDFSLQPSEPWRSPVTGAVYPTRWVLDAPDAGLHLVIQALVASAEVDSRASTGVVYWEGPVEIQGTVPGEGYAELTGYAQSLEERF